MAISFFAFITWNTWQRKPTIRMAEARFLRQFLAAEATRHGAHIIALGMVSDHVHLLLRVPGAYDIPKLVQHLKGKSTRVAHQQIVDTQLKWARAYDARSVGPAGLTRVISYIQNQHIRHPDLVIREIPAITRDGSRATHRR